ncbi:dynein heavy chain, cytoplasmic-like, partial [Diaphorina citri]|uniref:Dynein heavy chain, cytoplasmic-like n=1 Tax=Diaphorina citri TaxID=121845 RepID=A0A1S4EQS0_DIACI
VQLRTPVSTVQYPKINEWLTMLEKEMRVTLASYLADAVQDIKKFRDGDITAKDYMEWKNHVQRSLERLSDLLGKIQKALGEYLERERTSFPRFYFVGDEDLLEIIGNSKNIQRLQKHFKKMFAGVASIMLNEDNTIITGIASREGEE